MTKTRKVLTLAMAACLLVAISIGATMAYLTSTTGTVTNTFTVGNVKIKLDECVSEYDSDENAYIAKEDGSRTTEGQSYKLLPGTVVDKDPTVTVVKGSEDCYVRAFVTITYKAAADDLVKLDWLDWDKTVWVPEGGPTTDKTGEGDAAMITRVYEIRYNGVVSENDNADTLLADIFETVTIPETLTGEQIALLDGFKIEVQAQAIQSDGFDSDDAAWEAFA